MCVPVSVDGARPRQTRLDTGCDEGLHWVAGSPKVNPTKSASLAISHSGNNSLLTTVQLGGEKAVNVKAVYRSTAIFRGETGLLVNGILSY